MLASFRLALSISMSDVIIGPHFYLQCVEKRWNKDLISKSDKQPLTHWLFMCTFKLYMSSYSTVCVSYVCESEDNTSFIARLRSCPAVTSTVTSSRPCFSLLTSFFSWKDEATSPKASDRHTVSAHLHEDCVLVTKRVRWGEKEEGIERCVFALAAVVLCVCEVLWSDVFEEERLLSVY